MEFVDFQCLLASGFAFVADLVELLLCNESPHTFWFVGGYRGIRCRGEVELNRVADVIKSRSEQVRLPSSPENV